MDFDKLGVFYLGRPYDERTRTVRDGYVLYDSKDLLTHAVCVGMTGSGKTGLCIGLLEEAALDGIPAIAIDPKGDLANLALTFPNLAPEEFAPWMPVDDSSTPESTRALAEREATRWRAGLAQSGQDAARVRRLKEASEVRVLTPGSRAGLPVSILKTFAAPGPAIATDDELFHERVATSAQSLLGLLSIDADPLASREFILLSAIFTEAWKNARDLDLPGLIQAIQSPGVAKIGVLDLEAFYPAKERFQLALRVNNLLASPSFAAWLEGEPLDVERALYAEDGRPRISIYSIAHLSDSERMFFVALLLEEVLAWTRRQSGTQSLRAIVYMDEIFGYFPPVAEPPSKRALLTLLKQARAFGVGVVLATQNPVDLDYKGLANAGTWFVGRLQTERDKARVLDGLEAASQSSGGRFDRASIDRLLSSLDKRVFLLHDVHEEEPALFETRFTLSYLRGPLTRIELARLRPAVVAPTSTAMHTAGVPAASASRSSSPSAPTTTPSGAAEPVAKTTESSVAANSARPVLPPGIPEVFLPARRPARASTQVHFTRNDGALHVDDGAPRSVEYVPCLLGCARVSFRDTKAGVVCDRVVYSLADFGSVLSGVDWDHARAIELAEADLASSPTDGARFAPLPPAASQAKSHAAWKKSFVDFLARTQKLELLRSPTFKLASQPGEAESAFRTRLTQAAREARDALAEKLRRKYAPKLAVLEERRRRALQTVERETEQAKQSKIQTAVSFGATLLSAFTGRKALSAGTVGKATTTARGASRALKEDSDVDRARETVRATEAQLAALDGEFRSELAALETRCDPAREVLERVVIGAKKTGIEVRLVALAWCP
ncbi:MAG: ATP-binding protein [Planctomycetota bacterium]